MPKTTLAPLAVIGAIIAGSANAQTPIEPTHRTVSYADLDMSSSAGMATLKRRIDSAARWTCTDAGDHLAVASCRIQATRTALNTLDARLARARIAQPAQIALSR
jgi:UrcA family protein